VIPQSEKLMKAYSIDLREKIVLAYSQGDTSVRKVADRFGVAKSFVQKLLSMKKTQGHVEPRQLSWSHEGRIGWI
jgi:transposase